MTWRISQTSGKHGIESHKPGYQIIINLKSADEVLRAIADLIEQEVDEHNFIVPIFGVELDGIDSFSLGTMTILIMSSDVLDSAGVKYELMDISHLNELNKGYFWLKGTERGTPSVAQQRFTEQAYLTSGMLAIIAAALYELGAFYFRIGVIMSSEETIGRSAWVSWSESNRNLTKHYSSRTGQPFPLNNVLSEDTDLNRLVYRTFEILQTSKRTPLEEAIARAVFWYSDAHRDPILVMRLIKYWSCVEAFFSFEDEDITHAVASGLSSILVFGGFRFVPLSQYTSLKKQIRDLYKCRSKALHRGSHQHTKEKEVAQFSQWVAWMIISMVGLVEQGYATLEEVKKHTERLDGIVTRGRA